MNGVEERFSVSYRIFSWEEVGGEKGDFPGRRWEGRGVFLLGGGGRGEGCFYWEEVGGEKGVFPGRRWEGRRVFFLGGGGRGEG